MALHINYAKRQFKFYNDGTKIILPDPSTSMTPEQVIKFYAAQYPSIISSSIEGPEIIKDVATYTISHKAGTKG
jgi:PRTRC genetic system protein C